MTIKDLIRELTEQAYEQGRDVNALWIAEQIETVHAAEFDEFMLMSARKGVQSMANNYLRHLGTVEQPTLPSFELPQWLTVPDGEGGYNRRPLHKATLRDLNADLDVRRQNAERASEAVERIARRNAALWSVEGACEDMLISDAIALLEESLPDVSGDDADL
jgi:hypothetical protein